LWLRLRLRLREPRVLGNAAESRAGHPHAPQKCLNFDRHVCYITMMLVRQSQDSLFNFDNDSAKWG
jgi:hypothetical protein